MGAGFNIRHIQLLSYTLSVPPLKGVDYIGDFDGMQVEQLSLFIADVSEKMLMFRHSLTKLQVSCRLP